MLLLDTCILVWLQSDRNKISPVARKELRDPAQIWHVSSISAWEIGIGVRKRRLKLSMDPAKWFERVVHKYHLQVLDVSWKIALSSTQLPPHHADPADRLIIATALEHNLRIVTPDPQIPLYEDISRVW